MTDPSTAPFPRFTEDEHLALDELEDHEFDASVRERLAAPQPPSVEALIASQALPPELEDALRVALPALDDLAVRTAQRLVSGARQLLDRLEDAPEADPPATSVADYEHPDLLRLDEIRRNPTLALVSGRPERSDREVALNGARQRLEALEGQMTEPARAWAMAPTLATLTQVLRPDADGWLAAVIQLRHAHAHAHATDDVRDASQMIGTLLRAAFVPTVAPPPTPSASPAAPALAHWRSALFEGANEDVRAPALAADRPDLIAPARAIVQRHERTEDALATFDALMARAGAPEVPAPKQEHEPPALGDPPLRKITWWRVFVFLLLVAGSVYMYLLR